jgi:hypothetical protein
MTDEPPVESVKQLAKRVGLKERQIRWLIDQGKLEHIKIASRTHIPVGAWARYLAANTVRSCPDGIRDLASAGSPSAVPSTSSGPSAGAAASAALALATAKKLKSHSLNGSAAEPGPPAPVIPLRSS